jgi:P4 family phage/plasmid primase-like protien
VSAADLLAEALAYVARGWAVFPVRDKVPLPGTHGLLDATADADQVRARWSAWPGNGIGIVCGAASGILVLDVDPRHGGDESLEQLVEQFGPLPEGPEVKTGGGGTHYYYSFPGGTVRTIHGFRAGLDLQSDRAYVVGPPSEHPSGSTYEWIVPPNGAHFPLPPPWLLAVTEDRKDHRSTTPVEIPAPAEDAEVLGRVFEGPNGDLHRRVYTEHLSKGVVKDYAAYVAFCSALYFSGAREEQVPRILQFDPTSWTAAGRAKWRSLVNHRGYYYRRETLVLGSVTYAGAAAALTKDATTGGVCKECSGSIEPDVDPRDLPLRWIETEKFDRKGNPLPSEWSPSLPGFVAHAVHSFHPATIPARGESHEEFLVYSPTGVYVMGEPVVREWVESGFRRFREDKGKGRASSTHFRAEVIGAAKAGSHADPAVFDPDGLLCLVNGVFDIGRKTLAGHSWKTKFRLQLPITYTPGAVCPTFLQFLEKILPNAEDRALIQEEFGYTLRLGNPHKLAFFWQGEPDTGKSTLLAVLREMLGTKNVAVISLQSLTTNRFAAAGLEHAFALTYADLSAEALRYTGTFKMLVGGSDELPSERKFMDAGKFVNRAKLFFSANELPPVPRADRAFFRRWKLTEFKVSLPISEQDTGLLDRMKIELPGVFNWALEGLARLEARRHFPDGGRSVSGEVEENEDRWLKLSDSLRWFVTEYFDPAPTGYVSKAVFMEKYTSFCGEHNVTAETEAGRITGRLKVLVPGVHPDRKQVKGDREPVYMGIRWKPGIEPKPPEEAPTPVPASHPTLDGPKMADVAEVAGGGTSCVRAPARAPELLEGGQPPRPPPATPPQARSAWPPPPGTPRPIHDGCDLCPTISAHVCPACKVCVSEGATW